MKVARFGAVFDLDGVVARTEPLHRRVWHQLVADRRGAAAARTMRYLPGGTTEDDARVFFPELVKNKADLAGIVAESNRRYDALLRRLLAADPDKLKVPGACERIGRLAEQRVPLALNTSSSAAEAGLILGSFGLLGYFRLVLTGEIVRKHKPDPEGYLRAARELGLPPERCAGFEDSLAGLRSLNLAGYGAIVAVRSGLSKRELQANGLRIDLSIRDFSSITEQKIRGLLTS